MAKRLLVIDGDDKGHFFLSVEAGTMIIGGDAKYADIVLKDLHIARIHCEVEVEESSVVVSNSEPTTGTPAGSPSLPQELNAGENLQVGHVHLRLETAEAEPAPDTKPVFGDDEIPGFADEAPTKEAGLPAEAPAPAAAPGMSKRLVVIDGADRGRSFALPDTGTVTIGKSQKHADIPLHDLYVARVHCELHIQGDRIRVAHLEGQNGTLVNGQRITDQELQLGDVIRIGNSHLRLELAVAADGPASKRAEDVQAASQDATSAVVGDEDAELVEVEAEVIDDEPAGPGSPNYCLPHSPVDQLLKLEDQAFGHYQIGRLLGRGQSGIVFRAQDLKTNHVVALKVLSPDFPKSDAELQRFVKALKVLPNLHHDHLVAIHGAGKTGPYCWIAREYVDGESLARLIGRLNDESEEDQFDWTRACRVAFHLGKVLDFLHKHKVTHGNITPRNILIRNNTGMTKLADVMLNKALEGSRLHQAIREKKLLAELPYVAPEQTDASATVDNRADLYALGTVLYALLTGRPAFGGASATEVLTQIREAKVVKPTKYQGDIPTAFEVVVLKMMARRREDRFQTAAEILAFVQPIADEYEIEM